MTEEKKGKGVPIAPNGSTDEPGPAPQQTRPMPSPVNLRTVVVQHPRLTSFLPKLLQDEQLAAIIWGDMKAHKVEEGVTIFLSGLLFHVEDVPTELRMDPKKASGIQVVPGAALSMLPKEPVKH